MGALDKILPPAGDLAQKLATVLVHLDKVQK